MSRWFPLAALLAACSVDGQPRVVPSELAVADEAQPLRIEGLASSDFLAVGDDGVGLAATYRIAGVALAVQAADASGVSATLGGPLPAGSYALDVVAGAHRWHADDALRITDDGTLDAAVAAPDAARCPAAPADCTAFTCGTHCYYACSPQTGSSADAQCVGQGLGCLATIDDAGEDACVAAATGGDVWIGMEKDTATGAAWTWACPDGTSYTGWKDGAVPAESGCARLGGDGTWTRAACSEMARYVCRI